MNIFSYIAKSAKEKPSISPIKEIELELAINELKDDFSKYREKVHEFFKVSRHELDSFDKRFEHTKNHLEASMEKVIKQLNTTLFDYKMETQKKLRDLERVIELQNKAIDHVIKACKACEKPKVKKK